MQQNAVFCHCERIRLDPNSLQLTEEVSDSYGERFHRIAHAELGAYFPIEPQSRNTRGTVGQRVQCWPEPTASRPQIATWPEMRAYLFHWLDLLQQESDASDLWATAAQQREWPHTCECLKMSKKGSGKADGEARRVGRRA